MRKIPAVVFTLLLMASARPAQEAAQRVLTAEDFAKGQVDRGTGREEKTFLIRLSGKLPPYSFRLIPKISIKDPPGSDDRPHYVGRIEIANPRSFIQTIKVYTRAQATSFISFFRAEDINFDGYLDIAVVDDFGAKWGSLNYWVFDRRSGRFVMNALTRQIKNLKHSDMYLDPGKREITIKFFYGVCPQSHTYRVGRERLTLVRQEQRTCTERGDKVTVRERDRGKMRVVKQRQEPKAET